MDGNPVLFLFLPVLFDDSYFTLLKKGEFLYKDRGSKFFAFAFPVKDEAEIKAELNALREKHPSATHHCYAWRLGPDKTRYRVNDDGEPSGTAGRPIFSQIQSNDLTDVLIVVVRYFGGTLLGVNGLIQSYREAALGAITNAGTVERFITFDYEVCFENEDTSALMRLLKECKAQILDQRYDEKNILIIRLMKKHLDHFHENIKNLYKVTFVLKSNTSKE
jgi:uncharacterized YigZ family protein